MQLVRWCLLLSIGVMVGSLTPAAQQGTVGGEWLTHGGDKGFTRYSPLDQINEETVKNLRVAWRRPALVRELRAQYPDVTHGNQLQSTPIMVNGVLYGSNAIGLVEAFDPATGKTIWIQELEVQGDEALTGQASRGVGVLAQRDRRTHSLGPSSLLDRNGRQDGKTDSQLWQWRQG